MTFKIGDRVAYNNPGHSENGDTGEIVSIEDEKIWVKWDSDGEELNVTKFNLIKIEDSSFQDLTERLAIAFLEGRGFIVTKEE